MSAKTKIVVLHMKELIYTVIFIALGILLILLLVFMFLPGQKKEDSVPTMKYVAGVYTSSIQLNNQSIDVEVVVDDSHINSIRFINLDEAVTTMYPLIQPALDELAMQIYSEQSLEGITYSDENKYTSMVLFKAIESALQKAKIPDAEAEDKKQENQKAKDASKETMEQNIEQKNESENLSDSPAHFSIPQNQCRFSRFFNQIAALASLGIRKSPLGERETDPTFGPSGRQERLNCWEKKRL